MFYNNEMVNTINSYIPSRALRIWGIIVVSLVFCLLDASPSLAVTTENAPGRGVSILNILFLGVIAYFLVRAFRRRNNRDDTRPGNWTRRDDSSSDEPSVGKPVDRHEAARQAWSVLRSEPDTNDSGIQNSPVSDAGFDEAEFLEGAKLFFTRVQQADSESELAGLKGFLSEGVYDDLAAAFRRDSASERVEVMLVTARLMEMQSMEGHTRATVFYDAQLRKGAGGEQPVHVRAAWEFSRDDSVDNALWVLDKINKVDH